MKQTLIPALVLAAVQLTTAASREFHVYFGTYTGEKSRGIYVSRFDARTGTLGSPELAAETRNPSFLAADPRGRWLFAVSEVTTTEGKRSGGVSAFARDPSSGRLAFLNQQPTGGAGPCHVALDSKGRCLLVANYGGGSIASLPVRKDGTLGPPVSEIQHAGSSVNPRRQTRPHAHFIAPDRADRFALVCDLGLDQVLVYRLDPRRATLTANDPPFASLHPGAGPRHLAFTPDNRFVQVVNELDSTLTAFAYDRRRGELTALETVSTLPAIFPAGSNTCAEVQMHPSGRFVYASNRGHDSIAVFRLDAKSGRPQLVEHQATGGRTPRHFAIDPTGHWLLAENQASDTVVVFQIDPRTGRLSPTGQGVEVPSPVCAVFVPVK